MENLQRKRTPIKLLSVVLGFVLTVGIVTLFPPQLALADPESLSDTEIQNTEAYPWTLTEATGDYIADSYADVSSGHVFESVTQERLLDILSSSGNYYVVFGGPSQISSQKILAAIDEQAKTDGITKIYHFDPFVDGYQADITKSDTPYKGNSATSINQLWTRITALLPNDTLITDYDSRDTLLFLYNRNEADPGTNGTIVASYSYANNDATVNPDLAAEKSQIAQVFKGGGANVVPASTRTDLQFFNRVYNASASRIEGTTPSVNRIGEPVTLFDGLTEDNFKLHQINFVELQNLYNTPGEHIILYGASWCHNTQAIIGTIAAEAAKNDAITTVYVYDTTLGNQVTYGTGENIDVATGGSSSLNSRNSATIPTENNNISYIYGEAVKPLGDFITENNSYQSNSIAYFPNGDLSGSVTTAYPWDTTTEPKRAIRLQLPFLISYDKDATSDSKATRQWLHEQNDGRYLEYMLEFSWVRATPLAAESTTVYKNGQPNDAGLTLVQAAAEAVDQVQYVLQTGAYRTDSNWDRLSGDDRYTTARAISVERADLADTVIVATGVSFPDALAASSLAGISDAPILLTPADSLRDEVSDEIVRLGAKNIFVVGGTGALSSAVETELATITGVEDVTRLGGLDRYATALEIFDQGKGSWGNTAIVASAENFADALSISSYAYKDKAPIFLSNPTSGLDTASVNAITDEDNGFTQVIIVGGSSAVPNLVNDQLADIATIQRLGGADRYETSALIANWAVDTAQVLSYDELSVAQGLNFPDALAGGALSGKFGSVLLLVSDSPAGRYIIENVVAPYKEDINHGYLLGGSAVISDELAELIEAASK